VSRQTIHAIEAGNYAPNTAVALKLAQKLGVAVEEIFQLDEPAAERATVQAELLDGAEAARTGAPVLLCRIDGRLMATGPESSDSSLPLADGILSAAAGKRNRSSVELFESSQSFERRLLLAGCDPGASILARHMGGKESTW